MFLADKGEIWRTVSGLSELLAFQIWSDLDRPLALETLISVYPSVCTPSDCFGYCEPVCDWIGLKLGDYLEIISGRISAKLQNFWISRCALGACFLRSIRISVSVYTIVLH